VCAAIPVPTPGTPGYVPGTATLSSGGNEDNNQQLTDDGINSVPGQVQSRINLKDEGMDHVADRHFDPSVNASQFSKLK
jgi:filamentous hemagglutinin